MRSFQPYIDYLESLLDRVLKQRLATGEITAIDAALDSQPTNELHRLACTEELRAAGAFFTGSKLAEVALSSMRRGFSGESIILDPACGAGDLLIACANRLPLAGNLAQTLRHWRSHIVGRDLEAEFVKATKIRLVLTAIRRGVPLGKFTLPTIEAVFPGIERRCGLTDHEALASASHIVINPPFNLKNAPPYCTWSTGLVNSAAIFLESCVVHARPGTRIVAILPDVLRSGSRYKKWRKLIESRCSIQRVDIFGQFDQWADVDVFIMEAQVRAQGKRKQQASWGYRRRRFPEALCDWFDVSVGPVVPYRDPQRGPWFPFVQSRNLPAWKTVDDFEHHRRFSGRVSEPPFAVIRRTSRPGDKYRAVGTIIAGKKRVAVENHLLILRPKDGTLDTCRRLIRVLRRPETRTWLDKRIRCRHLTVSSLSEMPWWGTEQ